MRICHLAAGAGRMYCGACARDVAMTRALIARGHEALIVPLYTPLRIEGDDAPPIADVQLGAVNAYLQQVSGVFARLPRPLAGMLDNEALLRWVSRFAVSTKPSELGPMTVSVLEGADGRQRAEVGRLLDYLEADARPDVVSITNTLLSGVAPAVKDRLGVPVICEVKGEDGFVEGLGEPHCSRARELMRRNAAAIDRFIAPTAQYAETMAQFLSVEPRRMDVVRSIVDAEAFKRSTQRVREPFTVGYISVITPRKGLHVLVNAVADLARDGRDVRLVVAGQTLDRQYWREIEEAVRRGGLDDRFEHLGEIDFDAKMELLHSLSVFCQPSIKPEALGTASLEAMAAGIPVVAPDEGVFPETVEITGGGRLFESGNAQALADALAALMDAAEDADSLGDRGAEGIRRHFSSESAGAQMERILRGLIEGRPGGVSRSGG